KVRLSLLFHDSTDPAPPACFLPPVHRGTFPADRLFDTGSSGREEAAGPVGTARAADSGPGASRIGTGAKQRTGAFRRGTARRNRLPATGAARPGASRAFAGRSRIADLAAKSGFAGAAAQSGDRRRF